ncbi:hypothetical protein EVAR_25269_1 [Eumeta japonica]|uniref:Uncharacterized protein n=1 Tax=Eumeta variegata TaxID=151549 RepID=A0A4C1VPY9_EUMVA|nr:hypothetical protein EVAR_25269_1 [Eumeta japonica]
MRQWHININAARRAAASARAAPGRGGGGRARPRLGPRKLSRMFRLRYSLCFLLSSRVDKRNSGAIKKIDRVPLFDFLMLALLYNGTGRALTHKAGVDLCIYNPCLALNKSTRPDHERRLTNSSRRARERTARAASRRLRALSRPDFIEDDISRASKKMIYMLGRSGNTRYIFERPSRSDSDADVHEKAFAIRSEAFLF